MATELPKQYDPKEAQPKWLQFWDEHGYFHSRPDPNREQALERPGKTLGVDNLNRDGSAVTFSFRVEGAKPEGNDPESGKLYRLFLEGTSAERGVTVRLIAAGALPPEDLWPSRGAAVTPRGTRSAVPLPTG